MKRLSLWLTVGFVLFSFSGGFAKEEVLPADLADLPPDVLKHDNYDPFSNPFGKTLKDSTNYWVGVLFIVPPDTGFTIGGAEFKVNNELINITDTAYLYLTKSKVVSGSPRPDFDNVIQIDTVVAPFNRLQGKPFSPYEFVTGELFWIVLGPIPGGPDTNSAGQGWWAFSDTQPADTFYNYVSFGDSNAWKKVKPPLDMGNFVIRARGTFSPLDIVINEVMFNADPSSPDSTINHEWVELYNRGGIQTLGSQWRLYNEANGSVMLPSIPFPSGFYLVVHLNAPGQVPGTTVNDGNRIDTYLSTTGGLFSNRQGGCALVKGSIALSVISWNLRNLAKNEIGADDTSSVPSFLNWETSFFAAKHLPLELFRVGRLQPLGGIGPLLTATSGISIGRNSLSSDSAFTLGSQWKAVTFMGGPNSAGSTMGRQNILPMDFDTLVSDTINQPCSWMIMLYIAGDYGDSFRSPDRWYFDILNQIEKALPAAPRDVNVAVFYDTRRGRADGNNISPLTGATFRGTLKRDITSDQVHNLTLITPSLNTGDSSVLSSFVKWAKDSLPSADHYVLALKGDGAGWEGLCGDSGSVDRLEMGELKSALRAGLGNDTLDLLILDAPLMSQVEVAAQVKDFAHRMVASPEMTGPADFDYSGLVNLLQGGADTSTLVGSLNTILENRTGKDPFAVWTTINLDNLNALLTSVNNLAIDLKAGVEDRCARADSADNYQLRIRNALRGFSTADHYGTQAQGMADFIDLRRFATLVNSISEVGCTGHKGDASSVADLLAEGGSGSVIAGLAGGGLDPNIVGIHRQPTAGGLSIYFPSARRKATPIVGKTFPMYSNRSDHPFDSTGLESEGGVSQGHRIYALDALTCYPHAAGTCSAGVAPNQPYPPVVDFDFVNNKSWDEFLIRYYKPVADIDNIFLSRTLNQPFSLNARGTSDPDSDSLKYFWDISDLTDPGFPCDSVERQDMDKDCDDDNTDDGDVKGGSSINLANGLSTPGDNILWLYVWDDNHLNSTAPRFQTSKSRDSFVVQIEFRGVQLAYEDLNQFNDYDDALDAIRPTIQERKTLDLTQSGARTTMDPDEFTKDAGDKPHIIWSTGTRFSTTFPESCRIALNNALKNDSQGVWISGPRIGNDTEAKAYLESLFNDTINASLQPVDTLFPDTNSGHHFLSDFGPLPLIPSTSLQSIVSTSVKCPTFPLLVTRSGIVVAVAKVISPGARGAIFSTFGLEHLADTTYSNRLTRLVLDWLTVPQPSAACGCPFAKGDMNGSGTYTSADAVSMLNCVYLGTGNCDLCFTDVNCSGNLTSADAVLELNKLFLGINTPPWCGP